jgi:hypothetical protein
MKIGFRHRAPLEAVKTARGASCCLFSHRSHVSGHPKRQSENRSRGSWRALATKPLQQRAISLLTRRTFSAIMPFTEPRSPDSSSLERRLKPSPKLGDGIGSFSERKAPAWAMYLIRWLCPKTDTYPIGSEAMNKDVEVKDCPIDVDKWLSLGGLILR